MKVTLVRPPKPLVKEVTITMSPDDYKIFLEVATRHNTVATAIYSSSYDVARINNFLLDAWGEASEFRQLVKI